MMYENDDEFPAEDPGNQLRAKLNGTVLQECPKSFPEVLYTASERHLLGDLDSLDWETAMRIVHLFEVARQIDAGPPGEVDRIRM